MATLRRAGRPRARLQAPADGRAEQAHCRHPPCACALPAPADAPRRRRLGGNGGAGVHALPCEWPLPTLRRRRRHRRHPFLSRQPSARALPTFVPVPRHRRQPRPNFRTPEPRTLELPTPRPAAVASLERGRPRPPERRHARPLRAGAPALQTPDPCRRSCGTGAPSAPFFEPSAVSRQRSPCRRCQSGPRAPPPAGASPCPSPAGGGARAPDSRPLPTVVRNRRTVGTLF